METPDCCWRCGKLGHHRQSCSAKLSKTEENLITRLCKRIHKHNQGLDENQSKITKPLQELRNFPVINYCFWGAPQFSNLL
jgi:hypothetical protein